MDFEETHDINCPNCGEDMGVYGLPAYCPDCGTELNYPEKKLVSKNGHITINFAFFGDDTQEMLDELMMIVNEALIDNLESYGFPINIGKVEISLSKKIMNYGEE